MLDYHVHGLLSVVADLSTADVDVSADRFLDVVYDDDPNNVHAQTAWNVETVQNAPNADWLSMDVLPFPTAMMMINVVVNDEQIECVVYYQERIVHEVIAVLHSIVLLLRVILKHQSM